MIVTFAGRNGAGKTLAARGVADALGCEFYSLGEIKRSLADDMGLTIAEFDALSKEEPEKYHLAFDEATAALSERFSELVVDAKMGWHFLPDSLKVFVTADDAVRGERVFSGSRSADGDFSSPKEALDALDGRAEAFREEMLRLYDADPYEPENFDVIIDTTELSPEQVVSEILTRIDQL